MFTNTTAFLSLPFVAAWRHRDLIRAILRRELLARFTGSISKWLWPVLGPLFSLTVFTIVFTRVLKFPAATASNSEIPYVLVVFSGVLIFNFFSEVVYRAPLLLHEYVHFIKRSIFPSDMLCWIAVLRSSAYAAIAFVLLLAFQVVMSGVPPLTALLLPLIVVPLLMFLVGLSWFLSALGAFTRDVAYLMIVIVPLLMFATPVFYAMTDVPADLHWLAYLNPLAGFIDMTRDLLLLGRVPDFRLYLAVLGLSLTSFWFGYAFFTRYQSVIVDVL